MNTILKNFVAATLFCIFLAGCSFSNEEANLDRINEATRLDVNATLKKWNNPATCREVQLVKESENAYVGYAELSDGSQKKVRLTRDGGTGRMILELSNWQ